MKVARSRKLFNWPINLTFDLIDKTYVQDHNLYEINANILNNHLYGQKSRDPGAPCSDAADTGQAALATPFVVRRCCSLSTITVASEAGRQADSVRPPSTDANHKSRGSSEHHQYAHSANVFNSKKHKIQKLRSLTRVLKGYRKKQNLA
jgi:hypothetical protein